MVAGRTKGIKQMNYIKKLENTVFDRGSVILAADQEIREFMAHLNSAKFQGEDLDGSRKDWISTNDVRSRLQNILNLLIVED